MSDDTVRIEFDFEVDPQSVGRIEKALANIAKQQERVSRSFAEGNMSVKDATAKQQKLNSEKQELLQIERSLNAESDRANENRKRALINEQALTDEAKAGLRAKQDQFDTISRDVSLAGDFQSNLGALRGLSSAAGLGGVSEALDIGGESVALVEELPRLLAATAGLPATIKASAAAMTAMKTQALAGLPALLVSVKAGAIGAGQGALAFIAGLGPVAWLALAAAAAMAVLLATWAWLIGTQDKATKATEEQIEAEKLGTEQAEKRLETIAQEQEKIQELIAIREDNGQKTDDLKDQEKDLGAETTALTDALGNGTTAINDTIEAENRLAEERTQAALEAGSDAATLAALQQKVSEANSEQLDKLIADLENRRDVLLAEQNALQATGDQSEETQARLSKLADSLGDVDEQLTLAGSSTSRAAAAEKSLGIAREQQAKEAEKAAKKEAQDVAKADAQAAKIAEKEQADFIKNLNKQNEERRKQQQKAIDIQTKADDDLLQLQEDFRGESREAFTDAQREELQETRSADKEKKDLLKNLSREEQDLIASGDIFSIADLREKASDDLADLRTDFDFDANERAVQRRDEAGDRLREAREQRQKLHATALAQLADLGVGQTAIRNGWRGMLTGLGNDLSQFAQAVTGRSSAATTAGAVSSVGRQTSAVNLSVSIDGAPIAAIAQQQIGALA